MAELVFERTLDGGEDPFEEVDYQFEGKDLEDADPEELSWSALSLFFLF